MLETILQRYSIEVVVNRTKISRKNLEKLQSGNFEGFTRPQAFGFVRILEREFDEDFGDLKRELEAWFEKSDEGMTEPIFQKEEGTPPPKKPMLWPAAIAALLVVGAALYYFLGMQKPAEPPREANATAAAPTPETPPAAAQEAAPEAPAASREENLSLAPEVREAQAAPEPKEESEPYVPLEPVALTPAVKLWFGVIDLKTKKRMAKVVSSTFEIDSHGRKLLITGHGRFEISDAFGNLFKFHDAKKHYFLIDDGLVSEIDAAEFRRLNGGKGW